MQITYILKKKTHTTNKTQHNNTRQRQNRQQKHKEIKYNIYKHII